MKNKTLLSEMEKINILFNNFRKELYEKYLIKIYKAILIFSFYFFLTPILICFLPIYPIYYKFKKRNILRIVADYFTYKFLYVYL